MKFGLGITISFLLEMEGPIRMGPMEVLKIGVALIDIDVQTDMESVFIMETMKNQPKDQVSLSVYSTHCCKM